VSLGHPRPQAPSLGEAGRIFNRYREHHSKLATSAFVDFRTQPLSPNYL
jgi:hypothetical protein